MTTLDLVNVTAGFYIPDAEIASLITKGKKSAVGTDLQDGNFVRINCNLIFKIEVKLSRSCRYK